MELITLKNQLSAEKQKPKRERNQNLINELHEQISQEKTILKKGFKNRQKQKLNESTNKKELLDAKKNAQYKKIRSEKLAIIAKEKASELAKIAAQTSKKKKK